jgi:hypothetical protein
MSTDPKIIPFKRTPEAIQALDQEFEEKREGRPSLDGWSYPQERECDSLDEWVREILTRRECGHTLFVADDPRLLELGFVDHDENLYLSLHLTHLKERTGVGSGLDLTESGRKSLIEGLDPEFSFSYLSVPPKERGLDPTLRDIWLAEVERPPTDVPELEIPRP